MKIYRGINDRRVRRLPRAVAIGVFDGVHRGHRAILSRMLRTARRFRWKSLVITFDPPPARVLKRRPRKPILMSLAHRLRLFEALGVDETLVIRFNRGVAAIPRERFLVVILLQRLGMKSLTVGHDFCFGRGGRGNVSFLRTASRRLEFRLSSVRARREGREIISSTRIRELVEAGNLRRAAKMLGRPVSVYGTVVRGRGRGRLLGFPTANLDPHHETLPPGGVYAATARWGGRKLQGVIHIGRRPTFRDRQKSVEVHFLNFRGDLYGKELELIFVRRLRDTRKFKSARLLRDRIREDIRRALCAIAA